MRRHPDSAALFRCANALRYGIVSARTAVRHLLVRLPLLGCLLLSVPALAGVGAQSSGVASTDPTNPSTDVQQQSAGFVAQNQQLQNAPANNGIALPGSVTGAAAAGGAKGEDAKDAAAAQKPQTPAAPPPPPPTYVSNMRPLNRAAEPTAPEQVVSAKPEASSATTAPAPAKPVAAPVQRKPPLAPQIAVAPKPKPVVAPMREAPASVPEPGGGRGAAPDEYTFYFGLAIAAALLALALATFLRIGRGEAPR